MRSPIVTNTVDTSFGAAAVILIARASPFDVQVTSTIDDEIEKMLKGVKYEKVTQKKALCYKIGKHTIRKDQLIKALTFQKHCAVYRGANQMVIKTNIPLFLKTLDANYSVCYQTARSQTQKKIMSTLSTFLGGLSNGQAVYATDEGLFATSVGQTKWYTSNYDLTEAYQAIAELSGIHRNVLRNHNGIHLDTTFKFFVDTPKRNLNNAEYASSNYEVELHNILEQMPSQEIEILRNRANQSRAALDSMNARRLLSLYYNNLVALGKIHRILGRKFDVSSFLDNKSNQAMFGRINTLDSFLLSSMEQRTQNIDPYAEAACQLYALSKPGEFYKKIDEAKKTWTGIWEAQAAMELLARVGEMKMPTDLDPAYAEVGADQIINGEVYHPLRNEQPENAGTVLRDQIAGALRTVQDNPVVKKIICRE